MSRFLPIFGTKFRRQRAAAGAVCCALALAGIGAAVLFCASVRVPDSLVHGNTAPDTVTLLDSRGEPLAELANADARSHHSIALSDMGDDLPRLTVALEDRRFRDHPGVDFRALFAAIARDLRTRRIVSGASTITEQLVKLASAPHSRHRTLSAKAREAVAAWKLERLWTKERILARYLNLSSYGNRLIGPEAAARVYFRKPARALTLAESVYLAGLPQAPSRLDPWHHPAAAEYKYQRSVRRLAQLRVIAPAHARALAENPPRPGRWLPARRAPHFVDALLARRRSERRDETLAPPATLRTTLDPELQTVAESLLHRHLRALNAEGAGERVQAAVVILENTTGAVRALVGSGDYFDPREGQVNGALRARSAGSTLKPFIYLNALDRRLLTAASILPDTAEAVRAVYADYDPQNYTLRHHGPVRVRVALGSSLNVPAVVTLGRVGARQGFYELRRWGFRFNQPFDDLGAGFVLGNADIRLLDLAAAYAGLARGGIAGRPRFLSNEHAPEERIASPEAAAIIADILCDPAARRATFGAGSPLDFPEGVRVAVKTGTSSAFRDKWCVGFNARHTVAVWAGRFDGAPLDEAVAIHAAAPLWHELMEYLLAERQDPPVPDPPVGERLVRQEICPLTGLLPAPEAGSPQPPVRELFLPGTVPTESAAAHFVKPRPDDAQPQLRLPAEYATWCRSAQNQLFAVVDPAPDEPLAILSPRDGAAFVLNDDLPAGQQMVELTSSAPVPGEVHWTVNGRPLAEFAPPRTDGRCFWPLARGEWRIEAAPLSAAAAAAVVAVRVTVE